MTILSKDIVTMTIILMLAAIGCDNTSDSGGNDGGASLGIGVTRETDKDGITYLNIDEAQALQYEGYANRQIDPKLTATVLPAAATAPNFKPQANSPALTGGATPPDDGFFERSATFIGAMGADDWTRGWTAYPTTQTGTAAPANATRETITNAINTSTTWTKDKVYVLNGIIYVGNAENSAPVILTVEAGTQIRGKQGSALVVTTTGRLVARGTSTTPIVFTADYPAGMVGTANNHWGGIVLNGKADLNMPTKRNRAEGLADAERNRYGGGENVDATHNCGALEYVRIEFAGQPLSATNELNGLTLNACGSNTTVDYLQVHRGIDDGVEIFGGSVNIKHVVITGSDDDGLDWDRGWVGKGQFIIIQQLPGRGNHGIEADNWSSNHSAQPQSKPTLFNLTLVGRTPEEDSGTGGEGSSRGMTLRVGSAGHISNMIVTQFTRWGLFIDSDVSIRAWAAGKDLFIKNSIFHNNSKDDSSQGWSDVKP